MCATTLTANCQPQGVEYGGHRVDALGEEVPPGTKVLVTGVAVRAGVLQLHSKNIKVRRLLVCACLRSHCVSNCCHLHTVG